MSDVTRSSADTVGNQEIDRNVESLNFIEIDLAEKTRTLWEGRKTIILVTAIFFGIGLFHYTFNPVEYQSTAVLIQEADGGTSFDGGGLLRTLAGGNFPSGGSNLAAAASGRVPLPPSMYPVIIASTDFQQDLIHEPVSFDMFNEKISIYEYFEDHYEEPFRSKVYGFIGDMTIYLPYNIYRFIRKSVRAIPALFASGSAEREEEIQEIPLEENELEAVDERLLHLSPKERSVIEQMRTRVTLETSGGLINISTQLPDPKAAALTNALVVEKIQEYITDYRLEKARQNLAAIQNQEEEARQRYEQADLELALFLDQNINLSTNVAETRVQYLQNQRNLRFNVYNSLAQEVEQARMSLEQQIPVFSVLEKSNLPSGPSTGSSNLVLILSIVIGLFSGMGLVLIRSSSFFKRNP
ncbi:MAG TPA: Wzz/FepE/Etk N-terminal domain-containing protein [Balneolaceae bacterium]|nr:Wzz/FepE/Etk N-terminal domain-containing protein [Balneolaceae bacterium]